MYVSLCNFKKSPFCLGILANLRTATRKKEDFLIFKNYIHWLRQKIYGPVPIWKPTAALWAYG